MDLIENYIAIIDAIITIYEEEELQKDLELTLDKIEHEFERLLNSKAGEYELSATHSVHTSSYYHFSPRLKKPKSLKEKFIRKSDGPKLILDLGITTPDEVIDKKPEIEKAIKRIDDIIGIKIVTELQLDCKQVHKLIQDNLSYLFEKHISLGDIDQQPQKMKNGLDIYRIKGSYIGEYSFELQIKSKINSAWGDIDHSLFYKDYSINPIRDTVQVSINRIGKLLEELELFLFDLRKSNNDYQRKADYIKLLQRFDEEFSTQLKEKFGNAYDIAKIAPALIYFLSSLGGNDNNKLDGLDYALLDFTSSRELHKQYLAIRNGDFELMLMEIVFLNWNKLFNNKEIISEDYESLLDQYLGEVLKYTFSRLIELDQAMNVPDNLDFIRSIFPLLITHTKSAQSLLSDSLYYRAILIERFFGDHFETEELNLDEAHWTDIHNLYFIHLFGGDISVPARSLLDNIEKNDLNRIIIEIKNMTDKLRDTEIFNKTILDTIHNSSLALIETIKEL